MIKTLDDLWAKSDRYRRLGLMLPAGDEPRMIDFNQHHQMLELVVDRDANAVHALARDFTSRTSLTASAIDALERQLDAPESAGA